MEWRSNINAKSIKNKKKRNNYAVIVDVAVNNQLAYFEFE
jgi:hypothetical protein